LTSGAINPLLWLNQPDLRLGAFLFYAAQKISIKNYRYKCLN
jgi:hypothetical protein